MHTGRLELSIRQPRSLYLGAEMRVSLEVSVSDPRVRVEGEWEHDILYIILYPSHVYHLTACPIPQTVFDSHDTPWSRKVSCGVG